MRNLPRFALVPLSALVSIIPFAAPAFVGAAGADTATDCAAAFAAQPDSHLTYATDPPERLAFLGQTVRLSAGWDPAAWDSLSSAVACVQLNDTVDDVLGGSEPAPTDDGAYDHTFIVPEDAPSGSVLCTRIRLSGDPAGDATEAVWVSKTHCFEVDHRDELPPDTTPSTVPPPGPVQPAASPGPSPDTTPVTSPSTGSASDTPGPGAFSPGGGDSPTGTPFDTAEAPPGERASLPPAAATSSAPGTPEYLPELPRTGFASNGLLHAGERALSIGLGLLVLFGRRRRRTA